MTDEGPDPEATARRRRRRRATSAQGAPAAAPAPSPGPQAAPGGAAPEPPPAQRREPRRAKRAAGPRNQGERGLQDLVGAGRSQLGVSGALRGRDVDRPTEEDLAEAERDLQIVRRNWTPPDATSK